MTQRERAFELLRCTLGAEVIAVRNRLTGEILWRKSQLTSCGYDSSCIDSESQKETARYLQEISDDGRIRLQ
jgi:hypothetical protein